MLTAQSLTVTVAGGRRTLLSGVDCSLVPGEVVALIGPNGAGKSTLLSALSGLRAPSAGEVLLDGKPLAALSATARARRVAVLSQSSALSFPFRVRDVVALGRWPHEGTPEARRDSDAIAEALARLDLHALAERDYLHLSGGEQQRVHLARVLAQAFRARTDDGVLLLDEPVAALDPRHQHATLRLVTELARTGLAVAVVLHDLALAARYATRLLLLDGGRLVAAGPPARVLRHARCAEVLGVSVRLSHEADGTCVAHGVPLDAAPESSPAAAAAAATAFSGAPAHVAPAQRTEPESRSSRRQGVLP